VVVGAQHPLQLQAPGADRLKHPSIDPVEVLAEIGRSPAQGR
jgi:hypothetical protein